MSAKDLHKIALMPAPHSAHTACSREEPQPKFCLRPGLERLCILVVEGKVGITASVGEKRSRRILRGYAGQILRRNNQVCVDVLHRKGTTLERKYFKFSI